MLKRTPFYREILVGDDNIMAQVAPPGNEIGKTYGSWAWAIMSERVPESDIKQYYQTVNVMVKITNFKEQANCLEFMYE